MNSAYVYIVIFDTPFDPAELTVRLGLQATRIERKGERRRGYGAVRRENAWIIESTVSREDYHFENHVADLLSRVEPKKKEIRNIVDEYGGRFVLVGYFHHANDGIYLTKDQTALIAEMGLEVEADIYFMGEEQPNKAPEPTPTSVTPPANEGTTK